MPPVRRAPVTAGTPAQGREPGFNISGRRISRCLWPAEGLMVLHHASRRAGVVTAILPSSG